MTKVLYNGHCPVCAYEINHYAAYARTQGLPIKFDDLNGPEREAWGLSQEQAERRLYVEHDGALVSGVPAFIVLWSQMPRFRWLARIVGLPGIRHVTSALYDVILAPALYQLHQRRKRRRAAGTS